MQFEDGSQLDLLDPGARIVVDEVTRERVSVRLLSGHARVDVVPRKERAFRVQCGEVTVEVLGTAFEVLREGARTRVSVLRGRVAVHEPGGSSQLSAGEVGWFPKQPAEPAPQPAAAAPAPGPRAASKHHDSGWQAQAERGDYKRAYELMPGSPERVSDDVQELLLAADAARLSGHPAQAVPFLRRVIERHPGDARASLAAFTHGGVLLNQLDRPREAEAAYARARSLALSPALAQDALARQVEAAQRAGDVRRTRELAREYLRSYPNGRRVQWVKELSGS
jgi:transmembrane sensor